MAYYIINKPKSEKDLTYLPFQWRLKDDTDVILMPYSSDRHEMQLFGIFRSIVHDGDSYPQAEMNKIEEFRQYFVTHNTFVCVLSDSNVVVGAYYVKPNFPGRSSHICNGGFIVHPEFRNSGLGRFMTQSFLFIARDLGYESSFFNLVYETNTAAIHLYRSLNFKEIGIVPGAGKLKGHPKNINAVQFYYDFSVLPLTFQEYFKDRKTSITENL